MKHKKWLMAALFGCSVLAGWAGSVTAVECLYPYVTRVGDLQLVEVTRDGEVVEDLEEYGTESGRYGVRGYAFGIQLHYEGDGGATFRRSFAREE